MSYNNKSVGKNWIAEAISNEHINHYEFKDFDNVTRIGSGGFGEVYRANWKNPHNIFALKSLNDSTIEKFVYELKIQRKVNIHDNIIRFCGITTVDENNSSKKYMLVMEYADGGILREYLGKNFGSLAWNNKFEMARQLARAVSCLHNLDVIHRDLYSNNVLIHEGNVKLADFGLSKKIDDSITSKQCGVIPYIDPKKFCINKYSLNKKSDVYSIGVLLWEISSGQPPFKDKSEYYLVQNILNGLREKPIPNTPEGYIKIYSDCWKLEPDDRPDIHEVVARLEAPINTINKSSNDEVVTRLEESIDTIDESSDESLYESLNDHEKCDKFYEKCGRQLME
ncbi:hypothetical protein RclHR1_00680009 [Rhizophagus clarus]|uniref:Protein kinase domain-containing protein n=1 Tax=Rhizophagus clarus TaxID=94130 RepID=A0A2Z6S6F4_9GLOM|nr:hypothetical protein RclHR1_00680009 [Rhizophagus clarus]